ncbi:MAG: hypothetical protein PUP92_34240 [Rhizonema sp. PD38]|nr:hypothetical protein [Rhizonema sp. PD38]
MTIKVLNEQQILTEAMQVLMTHLEPSKVLRFWAACGKSESDYLKLKEQLFATETAASLYDKVKAFENSSSYQL